ncbi:hypothetical protein DL768_001966 [Monosporascus sp. mg162]|nr:hypothetical protein DL768_001966 [Monosporascus sp. mg162]
MSQGMVSSIFEYLTAKNPDLAHENLMDSTLTRDLRWRSPKQVKPWKEFSFPTIEKIFGGRLEKELMRGERQLDYPAPKINRRREGTVSGEDTMNVILDRWTAPMVTAALEAVDDVFHPVFWVSTSRASHSSTPLSLSSEVRERSQGPPERARKSREKASGSRSRSRSRPKPDGAGISFTHPSDGLKADETQTSNTKPDNRLACEVKPGSMWTSEKLLHGELVDDDGNWLPQKAKSREASPLVQIYNYCVDLNVRYGFLITSKEILAIRIGAPPEAEPPRSKTCEDRDKQLRDILFYHGVMEYAVSSFRSESDVVDNRSIGIHHSFGADSDLFASQSTQGDRKRKRASKRRGSVKKRRTSDA